MYKENEEKKQSSHGYTHGYTLDSRRPFLLPKGILGLLVHVGFGLCWAALWSQFASRGRNSYGQKLLFGEAIRQNCAPDSSGSQARPNVIPDETIDGFPTDFDHSPDRLGRLTPLP